ncbi:type II toxin-antitoxin system ParD family antitoxin [Agrobacterium bohemicum]|uniref:Addiction module antitoxin n=1 Tax=Agrobacterium bohemicum TaxID=2052828 RepID=A0A135P4W8_9HYPH|nr:type II toxin-antitoxin system ParD family antitoxin [Agrobacterium bohemicum]KXG86398.1 addiction module antitoxin [Agrobacterium bohemicum]
MTEIHLSEQDRKFIDEQVKAGAFEDADAVVHASLQLLGSEQEELKRMIADADAQFERGEYLTFTTADNWADSIIKRGMSQLDRSS